MEMEAKDVMSLRSPQSQSKDDGLELENACTWVFIHETIFTEFTSPSTVP